MNTQPPRKYDLEQRTKLFAQKVRQFVKKLPRTLGNVQDVPQLIRSSGSVAANYIEANEALGRKDFLMRARIALKESKETALWLELCETSMDDISVEPDRSALLNEANQLIRIFSAIIKNAEKNSRALIVGT